MFLVQLGADEGFYLLDKGCSTALVKYAQRLGEIFIILFFHHLVQKPAQLPDVLGNFFGLA